MKAIDVDLLLKNLLEIKPADYSEFEKLIYNQPVIDVYAPKDAMMIGKAIDQLTYIQDDGEFTNEANKALQMGIDALKREAHYGGF